MADPRIQIRRSSVPGKIPTAAQLSPGEFAINTYDGKVYIEQDQGGVGVGTTVIVVNPWSVGTGTNTYNTYFTSGNIGIGTTNPTSKLYVDGDGYFTGILTANRIVSSLYGEFTGGSISGSNIVGTSLSISGISTLGIVQISSGIVTATSGIVTYYGDGSKLSGVSGGVSVTNDTSTNATRYVLFDDVTTGTITGVNVSSTKLTFNPSTGNLIVGGTVTANSDQKLKENVQTIENALDKVLSLRGVEYTRIDNGDKQIGVIAQEVEQIIPEVVYPKQPVPDCDTKSVAYGNLIGLLIEAIKEQNQEIKELKRKLGDL